MLLFRFGRLGTAKSARQFPLKPSSCHLSTPQPLLPLYHLYLSKMVSPLCRCALQTPDNDIILYDMLLCFGADADWLADDLFFQSMPGARVPTPVDPTLTHSAAYNPWANVHGDDDLCSNLEVASIFDSRSTKCNDSAHDTSPRKASSSSSSVSTSTSCAAIYNPLVAAPRTHLPQVPEENSEEADEFTCKVNQLSEIFSRPPSGRFSDTVSWQW